MRSLIQKHCIAWKLPCFRNSPQFRNIYWQYRKNSLCVNVALGNSKFRFFFTIGGAPRRKVVRKTVMPAGWQAAQLMLGGLHSAQNRIEQNSLQPTVYTLHWPKEILTTLARTGRRKKTEFGYIVKWKIFYLEFGILFAWLFYIVMIGYLLKYV